jgi:hypothetical protein
LISLICFSRSRRSQRVRHVLLPPSDLLAKIRGDSGLHISSSLRF